MKKIVVVLLSMGLIVAFGMTASAADVKSGGFMMKDGKIVIKAGHHTAKGSFFDVAFEFFGKRLNELSGNQFDMQIYPAGQLGNQTELIQQLQKGSVQMSTSSMADIGNYSKIVNIMDVPFIFRDKQHAWDVADGPIGDMMAAQVGRDANIKVMGWLSIGIRSVFNSKKAIVTPADMKGMKIRTQPNPMHVAAFEVMGAIPTAIAYTELYGALQAKVVDGAENDPTNMLQMKFYETCKYYSLTEHFNNVSGGAMLMSPQFFNALSPVQQMWVLQAAKETTDYQRKWTDEYGEKAMTELKKLGVKINTVDKMAFQKAAQPFYENKAYPTFGKEFVETVKNYKK